MKTLHAKQRPKRGLQSILLTGVAGFIGSHLADRLLEEGYRVIGVDNFCTGSQRNLEHLADHPRFRFIEQDVCAPLNIRERVSWVFHFASPASPPKYMDLPIETMLVNSLGTHELLELARAHGAGFFLASTSEVYGDPLQHPQLEDYWGNVNPHGRRSVYDEGKRYAEAMAMAYHRQFGLPVRIIRIFNTYGPRMDLYDGRVVTNFIRQSLAGEPLTIYGDGRQTRSLQYIDDLVEGIMRYMTVNHPGPLNLGNPDEYTVLEIARIVCEVTKSTSEISFHPLPEDDPTRRRPDISRARDLLSWEPVIPFCEGVRTTVEQVLGERRIREGLRAAQG